MRIKKENIILIVIILNTLILSLGQYFLKNGALLISLENFSTLILSLMNIPLLIGVLLYLIGASILFISLKHGDLSYIYPILAFTHIWVVLISGIFLGEHISALRIMGVSSIFIGVVLIGRKGGTHG